MNHCFWGQQWASPPSPWLTDDFPRPQPPAPPLPEHKAPVYTALEALKYEGRCAERGLRDVTSAAEAEDNAIKSVSRQCNGEARVSGPTSLAYLQGGGGCTHQQAACPPRPAPSSGRSQAEPGEPLQSHPHCVQSPLPLTSGLSWGPAEPRSD